MSLWRWLKKWLAEHRWAIAWTSIFISAIWIIMPVAWVVRKNHGTMAMLFNIWFLAKASLDYQYLFPVALIPIALDLGLIMAWWVWPKIAACRDREVRSLKKELYQWEGRLRNMDWDLERKKMQIDSHCQTELHRAKETIKAWEREARAKIEAREGAVNERRQVLEEEIEEQRQVANEMSEKLKKREEELGAGEKECEARLARLDQWQAELEILRSKLTDKVQNLDDREQDIDKRERAWIEKEQASQPCGPGRVNNEQVIKDDLSEDELSDKVTALEEKVWKILSGEGEMKKRELERKINKSRYEQYWDTAIANLLTSGKIIYVAESNTYRCQQVLFP